MKWLRASAVLAALLFQKFCVPALILAAPESGISARDVALGGALSAHFDDSVSLYYNPAGLAGIETKEVSASYGFLNEGAGHSPVSDWSGTAAIPLGSRAGTIGISWKQFTEPGLYKEQMAAAGWARTLAKRISIGAAARYFSRDLALPERDSKNIGGEVPASVGLDAGILYLWRSLSFGFAAQGLNQPEKALSFENKDTLRSGINFNGRNFIASTQLNAIRSPDGSRRDIFWTVAGEKWQPASRFSRADLGFRGSYSMGPEKWKRLAAGCSYRLDSIQLDYALFLPVRENKLEDSQASHQLSFVFRFGAPASNRERVAKKEDLDPVIQKAKQKIEFYQKQYEISLQSAAGLKESIRHPGFQALPEIYEQAMARYWDKKDAGSMLRERLDYLGVLDEIFRYSGIPIREAEDELESVRREWSRIKGKMDLAWEAYLENVVGGAGALSRAQMLSGFVGKFAPYGFDLAFVEEELDVLR